VSVCERERERVSVCARERDAAHALVVALARTAPPATVLRFGVSERSTCHAISDRGD